MVKKYSVLIVFSILIIIYVTVFPLGIVFRYGYGKNVYIWELKDEFYSSESIDRRIEYYIDLDRKHLWDDNDVVKMTGITDLFYVEKEFLKVYSHIAEECIVSKSGYIWWDISGKDKMYYLTTSLSNNEGLICVNTDNEYTVEDMKKITIITDSGKELQGIEIVETIDNIRNDVLHNIEKFSQDQYKKVCKRIALIVGCVLMLWLIIIMYEFLSKKLKKKYEDEMDEIMSDYIR